jgi:recyclin-1
MELVSNELVQQSSLVAEVFPEKVDAFYMIVDRVFEDVVSSLNVYIPVNC